MKKLLYTFLAVSIIFSACKKESLPQRTGCTDPNSTNYEQGVIHYDSLCSYPTTRVLVTTVDENGEAVEGVNVYINNICNFSSCMAVSNENGIAEFIFLHFIGNSFYNTFDFEAGQNYQVWGAKPWPNPTDYEACGEIQLPYYNTVYHMNHTNHDFNAYTTLTNTLKQ